MTKTLVLQLTCSIWNTVEFGDYTAGPRIVTEDTEDAMRQRLKEIQNGTFTGNFIGEFKARGKANFLAPVALNPSISCRKWATGCVR